MRAVHYKNYLRMYRLSLISLEQLVLTILARYVAQSGPFCYEAVCLDTLSLCGSIHCKSFSEKALEITVEQILAQTIGQLD